MPRAWPQLHVLSNAQSLSPLSAAWNTMRVFSASLTEANEARQWVFAIAHCAVAVAPPLQSFFARWYHNTLSPYEQQAFGHATHAVLLVLAFLAHLVILCMSRSDQAGAQATSQQQPTQDPPPARLSRHPRVAPLPPSPARSPRPKQPMPVPSSFRVHDASISTVLVTTHYRHADTTDTAPPISGLHAMLVRAIAACIAWPTVDHPVVWVPPRAFERIRCFLERTFSSFNAAERTRLVRGFLSSTPAFHVATLQWPDDDSQVGFVLMATGDPLTPHLRDLCVVTALVTHMLCPTLAGPPMTAGPRDIFDRTVLRSAEFS
ncbi:Aste57867_16255 [Aphanomyces stellatus]|uniref:Aste57867_16255 protein n=1 Tax=Aphanomyces stellatus TaxID=120398 RepID=A0A485L5V0_9STRA|nr:hypothetical protein As57867_016198 [Aphanomyces stellatus]VFT93033.1 Aste57867_16255 [Aphanomyces stellatus]